MCLRACTVTPLDQNCTRHKSKTSFHLRTTQQKWRNDKAPKTDASRLVRCRCAGALPWRLLACVLLGGRRWRSRRCSGVIRPRSRLCFFTCVRTPKVAFHGSDRMLHYLRGSDRTPRSRLCFSTRVRSYVTTYVAAIVHYLRGSDCTPTCYSAEEPPLFFDMCTYTESRFPWQRSYTGTKSISYLKHQVYIHYLRTYRRPERPCPCKA